MNLGDLLGLTLEALRSHRLRYGLSALAIAVGVAAVVLLSSLGEGMRHFIVGQMTQFGTNLIGVHPGKIETRGMPGLLGGSARRLTLDDARVLSRLPGVTGTVPTAYGSGVVKFGNRNRRSYVYGVTSDVPTTWSMDVSVGQFIPEMDYDRASPVVVIGPRLALELFGDANPLGQIVRIAETRFRVIGVMQKKGQSLGLDLDDLIFVPVAAAQEIFNRDRLQEILAHSPTKGGLDRGAIEAKAVLMNRHDDKEDFTVHDQGDMLAVLTTIMGVLTYALAGIAGISLLVGGIGIMNIMLVSVTERTREIGIRKAVGARRGDILAQFLIESVILSSAGGIAGILLGVGAGQGAHAIFPDMPIAFSPWAVVIAFGFSFFVGVFFGVYPARRASLLDPIAALRVE